MAQVAVAPTIAHTVSRVAAAVVGGWAFTWCFVCIVIAGLASLGQPYQEAHTTAMLLAFVVFLIAFCWAIAAARLVRAQAMLTGGAGLMSGWAWLLQRHLL